MNQCIPHRQSYFIIIYCLNMRGFKATPKFLNSTLRRPLPTDKIVKKSDMRLNDVLINGVRLQCFKVAKNRRIILSRKSAVEEDMSRYGNIEPEQEGDAPLFKNNAIRRRLKSLEIEPLGNRNQETNHNKKIFIPYHKLSIEITPPSSQPKTKQQKVPAEELIQASKLADLNKKYYSQLKKELMMYSTNNRFNSSTIKRKIEFGKYIGLKSNKRKRYVSELGSNCIQEKIERLDKESQYRMRTKPEQTGLSIGQDDQMLRNSILSDKMDATVNSFQKLKICYSNMFQLKHWKEYPDENVNSMRETSRSITSHNQ